MGFRRVGAVGASLLVAAVAVGFTANGTGPFIQSSGDESLLLSQTFVSVAALTALLLAAIATELARAERASAIQRRRQALEINDGIIQGLAIASYQIEQGDGNSRAVIADTLRKARQLVDQLLDEEGEQVEPAPGDLRRGAAASVGGDGEEAPHARRAAD